MESESGVTRSIRDKLHSWEIHGEQKEGEKAVTRSIIDDLHSSDIQRDQMEGESGINRSIIDELHSSHIQVDQMERKSCLLEVSLMNFILGISKEIKWNVKVVLF